MPRGGRYGTPGGYDPGGSNDSTGGRADNDTGTSDSGDDDRDRRDDDDDDGPRTGGGSPSFPGTVTEDDSDSSSGSDSSDSTDGFRDELGGDPVDSGGRNTDSGDDDSGSSDNGSTGGGANDDPDPSPGPSTGSGEPSVPGGVDPANPETNVTPEEELRRRAAEQSTEFDPNDFRVEDATVVVDRDEATGRSGLVDSRLAPGLRAEVTNEARLEAIADANSGVEPGDLRLRDGEVEVRPGALRRERPDSMRGESDSENRGVADRFIEERLNPAAESFDQNVAAPIGEASSAVSPLARGADAVTGSDRFSDSRADFVRGGVNVLNVPSILAGGLRIGQRVGTDAGRVARGEGDEVASELEQDIAEATAAIQQQFQQEPLGTTSSLAGGAVAGFGVGAAATRGARAAGSAARGSGRLDGVLDDIGPTGGGSTGASSRTPNVLLRDDPSSGVVDVDPMVKRRLREAVNDRTPDNSPAGTTASDVFGSAGGPGPRATTGRTLADVLPDNDAAGTSASDVFGTAGGPGPRATTGRTLADVLPSNAPAGDTAADIFGTAPRSGTVFDRLPSNAPAGDTPADIFGTAPRSGSVVGRLPSNAPAGDTPADIFGTAPRSGTVFDRLPSNAPAGDTPADIFGLARAAEDTPPLSRDTTLRIGPARPRRTTATSADGDDFDFELVADDDDLDEFGLDVDDSADAAGTGSPFDFDVEGGSGAGNNQLTRLRSRSGDATDTDTRRRRQQSPDADRTPDASTAGIGLAQINDPTGVTSGNTDFAEPVLGFEPDINLGTPTGLEMPLGLDTPTGVDGRTEMTSQPTPTATGTGTDIGIGSGTDIITDISTPTEIIARTNIPSRTDSTGRTSITFGTDSDRESSNLGLSFFEEEDVFDTGVADPGDALDGLFGSDDGQRDGSPPGFASGGSGSSDPADDVFGGLL